MERSQTRSQVLLWTGIGAAVAGVAALVAVTRFRASKNSPITSTNVLRDIQSVLEDCYSKIEEIDGKVSHLTDYPAGTS